MLLAHAHLPTSRLLFTSSALHRTIHFQSRYTTIILCNTMAAQPPPPPKKIIICGGGVIGACTAYFLSTTKNSTTPPEITVIEKSSPACAASGKAGGFLALDWCDHSGPLGSLARASFHLHRSLSSALSGPASYGYRPLHTLSIPMSPNSNPTTTSTTYSTLPNWINSSAITRAPREIGTPETTAQVHPGLFTKTLLTAAAEKNRNCSVVIGEVERVEVEDGRVVGVVVKGKEGVVAADAVVLALGPWSKRIELVANLFGVSAIKAHSIVVRPKEPDAITPHALFLSYQAGPGAKMLDPEVYPRPTGEVYICGMSKEEEVPDDPATIVGEPDSIAMLHEIAGTVSSQLRVGEGEDGAEVVAEQACFLPCSEDGLPVIGELPGVKGCYVATGHSCWGILNGPATGAALAELILDGKASIVDLKPFSPSRFLKRRIKIGV